jgi:hypothetical protein
MTFTDAVDEEDDGYPDDDWDDYDDMRIQEEPDEPPCYACYGTGEVSAGLLNRLHGRDSGLCRSCYPGRLRRLSWRLHPSWLRHRVRQWWHNRKVTYSDEAPF